MYFLDLYFNVIYYLGLSFTLCSGHIPGFGPHVFIERGLDILNEVCLDTKEFFLFGVGMNFRPSSKSLLSSSVRVLELRLTILAFEPIKFEEDPAVVIALLFPPRRVRY